jgi:hypothetical protein
LIINLLFGYFCCDLGISDEASGSKKTSFVLSMCLCLYVKCPVVMRVFLYISIAPNSQSQELTTVTCEISLENIMACFYLFQQVSNDGSSQAPTRPSTLEAGPDSSVAERLSPDGATAAAPTPGGGEKRNEGPNKEPVTDRVPGASFSPVSGADWNWSDEVCELSNSFYGVLSSFTAFCGVLPPFMMFYRILWRFIL